jgi:hypothetical protein
MELPQSPVARLDIVMDPHPDTGELAICCYHCMMDAEATVFATWFTLEEFPSVVAHAQAALHQLECALRSTQDTDT